MTQYKYNADDLIRMAQAHQDADRFAQGRWWENGKGCSLGCMFHADNTNNDNYCLTAEQTTGIPYAINRFQERIFEWLPKNGAKLWTLQFYQLRPSEKDLSQVIDHLMLWILGVELRREDVWEEIKQFPNCAAAVENVAARSRRKIAGETIDRTIWREVERAAFAARAAAGADFALRLRDQFVKLIQEAPLKEPTA